MNKTNEIKAMSKITKMASKSTSKIYQAPAMITNRQSYIKTLTIVSPYKEDRVSELNQPSKCLHLRLCLV